MFHRSRQNLIVPVKDRRKHVRILTLKNFGLALVVATVALIGVDALSHFRGKSEGEFGRLYRRQLASQPVEAKRAPEIVTEAPVPDQTAADPLLIQPAVRSQYLGVDGTTIAPAPLVATTAADAASGVTIISPTSAHLSSGKVTIVGGAEGVAVVASEKEKTPKLTGGIFR